MDSPAHFAASVAPTVVLLALGLTRRFWPVGWKEVPTTALSAGVSLLVLLVLVSIEIGAGVDTNLLEGHAVLLSVLSACYALSLVAASRNQAVSPPRLALFGIIGLVPWYFLVGFTLVLSACGLVATTGC